MSEDEQETADLALVRHHLNQLAEHFDSVQIFATRSEEGELGGTVNLNLGAGNYFSRYGHVHKWLIKQDEEARIEARKESDTND